MTNMGLKDISLALFMHQLFIYIYSDRLVYFRPMWCDFEDKEVRLSIMIFETIGVLNPKEAPFPGQWFKERGGK